MRDLHIGNAFENKFSSLSEESDKFVQTFYALASGLIAIIRDAR